MMEKKKMKTRKKIKIMRMKIIKEMKIKKVRLKKNLRKKVADPMDYLKKMIKIKVLIKRRIPIKMIN